MQSPKCVIAKTHIISFIYNNIWESLAYYVIF
jgi:hypothetical protein